MMAYDVAIIGGGAAGIVSAISASRKGAKVVICERLPKLGKKILASGNGRCNLSNTSLDTSHYNEEAQHLVGSVLSQFGKDDITKFFSSLGLHTYSEDGRVFPVTNQASSVLKILELEMGRLKIPVELGFDVTGISRTKSGFEITGSGGKKIACDKVILAGGGKSYPALGSNGSLYNIALKLGHKIIEPVPSVVALEVKDRLCHLLQGQKIQATVKSLVEGNTASMASGDLLFTKYGLSGTAILDASEPVSIALNRQHKKDATVSVDMVPFMEKDVLESEIKSRIKRGFLPDDLLTGILPNKFGPALADILQMKDAAKIATNLKDRRFHVAGTRGWNEAEFTAGGVCASEVESSNLESKLVKGLYFAGEILNVNGKRGGYNLAWAWASGYVAGVSAAK